MGVSYPVLAWIQAQFTCRKQMVSVDSVFSTVFVVVKAVSDVPHSSHIGPIFFLFQALLFSEDLGLFRIVESPQYQ